MPVHKYIGMVVLVGGFVLLGMDRLPGYWMLLSPIIMLLGFIILTIEFEEPPFDD